MDYFDLSGTSAVVTGASRGIGKAIARGLAEAGASVMLSDVLDPSDAVEDLNDADHPGQVAGREADVTDRQAVRQLVDVTCDRFGGLDVLVNNAGIYHREPMEDLNEDTWQQTLDVNLTGPFYCAQEAGEVMIEQGSGSIINIASVAGLRASQDSGAYNVSKGGLLQFTRSLATDWGSHGIRANAICPGIIETEMTHDLLQDDAFKNKIENQVSLQRTGQPDEIAPAAIYLASDASSYMTGHALVLDGGWTCHL